MGSVTIRTQPITRNELAKFFPDNPRLVRLLETLTQDITVSIPDVLNPSVEVLDAAQLAADLANAVANSARGLALQALTVAAQINEGPPSAPQPRADAPDDVYAQIAAVRERIAVAERAIANIKEGPTP